MKRFFVSGLLGGNFELAGPEFNHLSVVLRASVGERVTVICGDEYDYIYEIAGMDKKAANLKFIEKHLNQCNPSVHVTVFLAVVKMDNFSLAVQKLNELGVSEIVPFTSANCNIASEAVNVAKLNTVAVQSCKQCGRSKPVAVRGVLTFEQLCGSFRLFDRIFFANENEQKRLMGEVKIVPKKEKSYALIIGCEGGFLPYERDRLCKLCTSVSLGRRILRSETAAIAAASVIMSGVGEM